MNPLKRLIWEYLDHTYPNSYNKLSKFGWYPVDQHGEVHSHFKRANTIASIFSCDVEVVFPILGEWGESLPKVSQLDKATRDDVLVHMNEKTPTTK